MTAWQRIFGNTRQFLKHQPLQKFSRILTLDFWLKASNDSGAVHLELKNYSVGNIGYYQLNTRGIFLAAIVVLNNTCACLRLRISSLKHHQL
jgi:hypothetical protein